MNGLFYVEYYKDGNWIRWRSYETREDAMIIRNRMQSLDSGRYRVRPDYEQDESKYL